jgi:toxin-antitoxin system PIN domain toxin
MYLCDSNVWLALAISGHVNHAVARDWFDRVREPASVLFCRATQHSFLRLLTNAAVYRRHGLLPRTNAEAWSVYREMLTDDRTSFRPDEPPDVERLWTVFSTRNTASPNLWMDAYLAAFARAASLQIVTADRGFRQFDGLKVHVLDQTSLEQRSPMDR